MDVGEIDAEKRLYRLETTIQEGCVNFAAFQPSFIFFHKLLRAAEEM